MMKIRQKEGYWGQFSNAGEHKNACLAPKKTGEKTFPEYFSSFSTYMFQGFKKKHKICVRDEQIMCLK